MSLFVASPAKLEGDAFVSNLLWSNVDAVAALATSTIDESNNEREIHQVQFINNDVRFFFLLGLIETFLT